MFESAAIGHQISKDVYRAEVPALRAALLDAQIELYQRKKMPVLVLDQRTGWLGQGRDDQPALRVDGPALSVHPGVCRPHRRGA